MPTNAGFVDSHLSSLVPFKLNDVTATQSTSSLIFGTNGERLLNAYVANTGVKFTNTVVPVIVTGEYTVAPSGNTGVHGYTNGDPEIDMSSGTPPYPVWINVRLNGRIMSGESSGTAAIVAGTAVSYNTVASTGDGQTGYPPIMNGNTGSTDGGGMIALQSASATEVAAGKVIDYLILF